MRFVLLLCLMGFAANQVWAQAEPPGDNSGKVCPNNMPAQQALAAGCRFIGSYGGYDLCANPGSAKFPQCAAMYTPHNAQPSNYQVWVSVIMPTQNCEKYNASGQGSKQDCSVWCKSFSAYNSTPVTRPQLPAICNKYLRRPQICSLDDIAQMVLDFDRGFWDFTTLGITKQVREWLLQVNGEILNQEAADVGTWTAAATNFVVPIPGPGKLLTIAQWSREAVITADVARWMAANGRLVWESHPFVRGIVIEKVLAATTYSRYRWVGVLNQEKFRLIDFIDEYGHEAVSLKTISRSTDAGWRSAELSMQKIVQGLGNVKNLQKQWVTVRSAADLNKAACIRQAANWKRVLEIRVPPGMQNKLKDLIPYGQQYGVEVRILSWP